LTYPALLPLKQAREKTSQALREGAPELRGPQKGSSDISKQHQVTTTVEPPQETQVLAPQLRGSKVQVGVSHLSEKGQIDHGSPPSKKMRYDGGGVSHVTKFWGGLDQARVQAMPLAGLASNSPLGLSSAHLVSPRLFSVTVSADDDDSKGAGRHVARTKPNGPRLKLLKKRLARESDASL